MSTTVQVEPYFRKKLDITNLVLAVGSGAPAFALASLRKDDKAMGMRTYHDLPGCC